MKTINVYNYKYSQKRKKGGDIHHRYILITYCDGIAWKKGYPHTVLSVFLVEPLTDTTSYAGATEVKGRQATVVRYNFLLSRAILACQSGGEGV